MRADSVVIHETEAERIDAVLVGFLAESGASEVLLIDRSGQPLAQSGGASHDTISIAALAAGAFSSTGAMAQLLGETEFSVLFHEGATRNIHVSTVDTATILLAIFDSHTTVGMVRLFAREASAAIARILDDARAQPAHVGTLAAPLSAGEVGPAFPADGGAHDRPADGR
jgi:predicted regulator of Ras-like GTPase activity (Roadblock/LC7/MglB family)